MRTNEIIVVVKHWPTDWANRVWRWWYGIKRGIRRAIELRKMRQAKPIILYAPDYLHEER